MFRIYKRIPVSVVKMMLTLLGISVFLAFSYGTAQSYTFLIDNFKIIRNGVLYFEDTFSSSGPPPSAPNFASGRSASYSVFGTMGPESGGKLTLDSSGGQLTSTGNFLSQNATLLTNRDPAFPDRGLKIGHTFSVTAVYDLILPSIAAEAYGVRVRDRTSTQVGNDTVELRVRRGTSGSVRVQFVRIDSAADTSTLIASTAPDSASSNSARAVASRIPAKQTAALVWTAA